MKGTPSENIRISSQRGYERVRVKFLLRPGKSGLRIGPFGSSLRYEFMRPNGTKVYGQENVIKNDFTVGKRYIDDQKRRELNDYEVSSGDVLITMMGTTGRCTVVPHDAEEGIIDSHLIRIRLREEAIEPGLFVYQFSSSRYVYDQLKQLSRGSIMEGLNSSIVKQVSIFVPPTEKQQRLLSFLDKETQRIDTLIKKKKRQIELLNEKRSAIITRAVTKGLDPNAKMKDSGVEWIGEIPENWQVWKLSRCVHIRGGQVDPALDAYRNMVLIAPNHIESNTGHLILTETAAEQGAESGKYVCQRGDVIYSKIRPHLAKATLAPEACLCSADMYPMQGKEVLTNPYLGWLLISDRFTQWAVLKSDRVAMPKLNRDTMNEFRLPVPPLTEQERIVSSLIKQTSEIDRLINTIDRSLQLLREYRSALITSAVSGQTDVSDYEAAETS